MDTRNEYQRGARHQMDARELLLRGGRLDGRTFSRVVSVGDRVFCGEGDWAMEDVYLVTAETVQNDEGREVSVCVPAFAAGV